MEKLMSHEILFTTTKNDYKQEEKIEDLKKQYSKDIKCILIVEKKQKLNSYLEIVFENKIYFKS